MSASRRVALVLLVVYLAAAWLLALTRAGDHYPQHPAQRSTTSVTEGATQCGR